MLLVLGEGVPRDSLILGELGFSVSKPSSKSTPQSAVSPTAEAAAQGSPHSHFLRNSTSVWGALAFQKYNPEPELQRPPPPLLGTSKDPKVRGNPLISPAAICTSGNHSCTDTNIWLRQCPPERPSGAMGSASLEFSWAKLSVFKLPRETFRLSSCISRKQSVQFAPV